MDGRRDPRGEVALVVVVVSTAAIVLGAAHGTALVPAAVHEDPSWLAGPLRLVPGVAFGRGVAAALSAVAFLAYLGALRWAAALRRERLLAAIGLVQIAVVAGPPLLSADVFSYVNDARLLAVHGLNPYVVTPAADPGDPTSALLGWHTGTSPYGALFTLGSSGAALLGPGGALWSFKAIALVAEIAVLAATWRLAAARGRDPARAVAFVGLNPLVLVWALGGAHNDLLALAVQLWALVALVGGRRRTGPFVFALATGVKATAGVALPYVLARRPTRTMVLGAAAGVVTVAVVGRLVFGTPLAGLGATLSDARHVSRLSVPKLGARVLGDGVVAPGPRALLHVATVLGLAWLLYRVARGRLEALLAAGWATALVLATSTWLLPWYAVWLVPLAAVAGDRRLERAALVVSGYLLLAGYTHGAPAQARGGPHRVILGRSVHGRRIEAIELRAPHARTLALVVGCIHGDEPAGIAVARALARGPVPRGADLWIVPDLNPDGVAADTRGNARGVDLNRNFPWRWRPLGPPGTQQYAGPHALSEPESRLARRLIRRIHPRVTVWFHQPLAVTDESGGDVRVERRFAAASGLPLRRLARYPGSAPTWQNHRFRGTTAFVVELPGGRPSAQRVARYAAAVRAVA